MERLKANSELRHIPVHFMSGSESVMDAMKMGAVGFVTKPVSLEKIEEAFTRIESLTFQSVRRLLVVEDDLIQRESIKDLIGDGDVETITVATGAEAYSELESSPFDCMILDLGLEDMSGYDLLEKIRADHKLGYIPIIIYTGRDLSQKEEAKLRQYSESIIIKGVKSPERLLDETALFLHRVELELPQDKQRMLNINHDKNSIFKEKKILLVDDDMRNVFALTSVLEEKGMIVDVAKNGAESLEKISKETNLVLMDIMMPVMDGYEAMRKLRKNQSFKKIPIIALTAKAMKGDRNKSIEAGASDYLAKPIDTEKLLSMLRVWLYDQ
jgi:CheY-like chemotaxis protein